MDTHNNYSIAADGGRCIAEEKKRKWKELNAGQKLQHEKKVAALSTVLCEQE